VSSPLCDCNFGFGYKMLNKKTLSSVEIAAKHNNNNNNNNNNNKKKKKQITQPRTNGFSHVSINCKFHTFDKHYIFPPLFAFLIGLKRFLA